MIQHKHLNKIHTNEQHFPFRILDNYVSSYCKLLLYEGFLA